jgi:hypothetical protein
LLEGRNGGEPIFFYLKVFHLVCFLSSYLVLVNGSGLLLRSNFLHWIVIRDNRTDLVDLEVVQLINCLVDIYFLLLLRENGFGCI